MRFAIKYPMHRDFDRRFLEPDRMIGFAQHAEELGYAAIAFTEHPAPSREWLDTLGHESLDPLTALGFIAGVTTRIRLMTYLLILPYRNPLLAGKQITTADIVSRGRVILGIGAGYLESEFAALGVDVAQRGDLLDEAVEAMRMSWTGAEFTFQGRHFEAVRQIAVPRPLQNPHPPLWFGGNSRATRRRAAQVGHGWAPLMIDEAVAELTRTPAIDSLARLAAGVGEMREFAVAAGRDPHALDVVVEARPISKMAGSADALLEQVAHQREAGTTWLVVEPPNDDADAALDRMSEFSTSVIARAGPE